MIETAQAAVKRIRTDPNGFTKTIQFTAPDGITTATIRGMSSVIHLGVDNQGEFVNTRKAHISFSESSLSDTGYTVRDSSGVLILKGNRVGVIDSTGVVEQYVIREIYPDEALGLLVCMLGDFE